jgi:hypothetical protein
LAEPVTTIIKVMTNMIVARIIMIMNTMVTMNAHLWPCTQDRDMRHPEYA